MKTKRKKRSEEAAISLIKKYFGYYATIHFWRVLDAVQRTYRDIGVYNVDAMHAHISTHYI